MGKLPLRYKLNPLFWYYTRRYKKLLTSSPESAEVVELAQRTGNIKKLWEWQASQVKEEPDNAK